VEITRHVGLSVLKKINMNSPPVAIIAFEEFDNLGVGYLASVLAEAGYKSSLIDFRNGKEKILKMLKRIKPLIVGFSIIFQYHINEFEELILFLRKGGISCHFTSGGQYASLRYEDLFEFIPSLDSVVRFDGEYTFLDLVNSIYNGIEWKNIIGIAFKSSNKIIVNPLRQVETDLDKIPLPIRSPLKEYALDRKFATILAGRGCINNCSFCYLREYYLQASGPFKRVRKPEKVAGEMEILHIEKNCSVFLFQDDDFPVKTATGVEWIENFCMELKRKNMSDKIMWKINCRPDEVDYEIFALMKNHGLFLVFLGIEDGTDIGLTRLNKHITVAKCKEGINILKKLEIDFDYGFMLFQPSSTYTSVNDNLDFLREMFSDGSAPVTFLKMMPFCATPIELELRKEGRLKGKPGFLDYDFLDESMNHYYNYVSDCLLDWLYASDGLSNISKWARNYIAVCSHYFKLMPDILFIKREVTDIISESNIFFLDTMNELSCVFESGKYKSHNYNGLVKYRKMINMKHKHFKERINNTMSFLLSLTELNKQL
jgi:anaerobic magnesium-protoporphyrin IX monomethyl ester cyclase